MSNNFDGEEFCAVCGGTFKGARSHKDKPYKTCKDCLDKEHTGNRSLELSDRINRMLDTEGSMSTESIEHFESLKTFIDKELDIDSVYGVKNLAEHHQAVFYNVLFDVQLNKKIFDTNEHFIMTSDKDNNLKVSLRKEKC